MNLWGKFKRRVYCWMRGLVRLPYGSVQVVQITIGAEPQLVEAVPAEFFSSESWMKKELVMRTVWAGDVVTIRLKNNTREKLPVVATAVLVLDSAFGDKLRYSMLFDFIIRPEREEVQSVRSPVGGALKYLLVALPEYVSKRAIAPPSVRSQASAIGQKDKSTHA